LVKLLFDETGSELAVELSDHAESIVSSQLVYPEARAAAGAAQRETESTRIRCGARWNRIDELCAELNIIGLDAGLAHAAGNLAEIYSLRAYHAVHLATALSIEAKSMLLATWDGELARAAVAAGCSVSSPPSQR